MLVDRSLTVGDVVKRHLSDTASGTVVSTAIQCSLQPLFVKANPLADLPMSAETEKNLLLNVPGIELQQVNEYQIGEYVMYDNWVGVIKDVKNEVTVRLGNDSVVTTQDARELFVGVPTDDPTASKRSRTLLSRLRNRRSSLRDGRVNNELADSFYPGQVLFTKKENLKYGTWKSGTYDPSVEPKGIVVETRPAMLTMDWLTGNFMSDGSEHRPQPPRCIGFDEIESGKALLYQPRISATSDSASIRGATPGSDSAIGDHVRFRDLAGAAVKYSDILERIPGEATLGFDMNIFYVKRIKSSVKVQWQDGLESDHDSVNLVPHLSVDDHDVWPGDIVEFRSNGGNKPNCVPNSPDSRSPKQLGVVQWSDAQERIARVRWFENPVLDVFEKYIILPGSVLGPLSEMVADVSLYDIAVPPALNLRRGDLVTFATTSSKNNRLVDEVLDLRLGTERPALEGGNDDINVEQNECFGNSYDADPNLGTSPNDWFGEIIDLTLDGKVTVRLGASLDARHIIVPSERVVPFDKVGDGSDDDLVSSDEVDGSMEYGSEMSDSDVDPIEETVEYEGGARIDCEGGDAAWSTEDEASVDGASCHISPDESVSENPEDGEFNMGIGFVTSPKKCLTGFGIQAPQRQIRFSSYDGMPKQVQILEDEVPSDHHFLHTGISLPARLLQRICKENAILETSLPDGIWVRTWASRLDLIRILIIGPHDTPYGLAPFVIDFQYGRDFPNSPPQAFFHSWSGIMGRINPNLYEDGKICLSLLGTWPGESKTEHWSARNSSMLQIIVSLMGLVLVKEPFYNEAGYDVLVGTPESQIDSALYSEKALVTSKLFVLHALTHSVGGFDDICKWIYLVQEPVGPKLLDKVLDDCDELLARSAAAARPIDASGHMNNPNPRLSTGAMDVLRRYVESLRKVKV